VKVIKPKEQVQNKPGALQTSDGPEAKYTVETPTATKYCEAYANRMDNKVKWSKKNCSPTWGTEKEIMENIDGVLCACGGFKLANLPPSRSNPGLQSTILARAQVTEKRIRSYSYNLVSSVDPAEPNPSQGFAWDIHLTNQAATESDHEVNLNLMRNILLKFNRIFEFSDNSGAGLKEEDTRYQDPKTQGIWAGRACDAGETTSGGDKKQNCVHQDFFLDNFAQANVEVTGTKVTITHKSDIQGTFPWCGKDNAACAKAPTKKPTVTFIITTDNTKFEGSKLNILIEDFPFRHKSSSLALGASVFAQSVTPTISKDDETSAKSATDGLDCTAVPPPAGCPKVDLDTNTEFNWVKAVTDTTTGAKLKVVTTHPDRVKSGVKTANGEHLIRNNMFFSFKHAGSSKLLWDPEIAASPSALPRDLKDGSATRGALPSVLAILVAVAGMAFLSN
jgi:hypothetical protein